MRKVFPEINYFFLKNNITDLEHIAKILGYRKLDTQNGESLDIIFNTKDKKEKTTFPITGSSKEKVNNYRLKTLVTGESFIYNGTKYVKVYELDSDNSLVAYKEAITPLPPNCWFMNLSDVSITRILGSRYFSRSEYEELRRIFRHPCIKLPSDIYIEKT